MRAASAAVGLGLAGIALVLQVALFPHLAWQGVVPNLVLLVVVGVALTRGADVAMVLGFVAGLALDLAPPADHLAGRWALALVVVGYVAGRVRQDARQDPRPGTAAVIATVAACSFVGTSIFALTGLVLSDGAVSVPGTLQVIGVALIWDLLLTPFVLPVVIAAIERTQPERERVAR